MLGAVTVCVALNLVGLLAVPQVLHLPNFLLCFALCLAEGVFLCLWGRVALVYSEQLVFFWQQCLYLFVVLIETVLMLAVCWPKMLKGCLVYHISECCPLSLYAVLIIPGVHLATWEQDPWQISLQCCYYSAWRCWAALQVSGPGVFPRAECGVCTWILSVDCQSSSWHHTMLLSLSRLIRPASWWWHSRSGANAWILLRVGRWKSVLVRTRSWVIHNLIEKQETVVIALTSAVASNNPFPRLVVCPCSSIEVPEDENLVILLQWGYKVLHRTYLWCPLGWSLSGHMHWSASCFSCSRVGAGVTSDDYWYLLDVLLVSRRGGTWWKIQCQLHVVRCYCVHSRRWYTHHRVLWVDPCPQGTFCWGLLCQHCSEPVLWWLVQFFLVCRLWCCPAEFAQFTCQGWIPSFVSSCMLSNHCVGSLPATVYWPGCSEAGYFRAPLLAPSSEEVSSVNLEEDCSVTQGAAGLHCCFSPVENDPMAWAACVWVRDYSSQCIHT